MHVPPFRHGWEEHSFTFVWQVSPLKPLAHVHVYRLSASTQLPPFKHGFDTHSSMFTMQFKPVNPAALRSQHPYTPANAPKHPHHEHIYFYISIRISTSLYHISIV